jgi:hypothetical protein
MRTIPENLSPEGARIVERVRCFLRWSADRFDDLDTMHVAVERPIGWKRNGEFWVKPDTWLNSVFDGDEGDSEHGARVLRDIGLLRTQAGPSLQCNVKVRGEVKRAYAVSGDILAWVAGRGSKSSNRAGALLSPEIDARLISPANPGDPANLAAILEQATRLGLARTLELLALSPDPDDRHYAGVLRTQAGLIGTMISAQLRADEVKFKAAREDSLASYLATASACAKATLGRTMTEEEVKIVLDGGYNVVGKPAPPGVLERLEHLREGGKPAKGRHDD